MMQKKSNAPDYAIHLTPMLCFALLCFALLCFALLCFAIFRPAIIIIVDYVCRFCS
ncbi:uncharacterized protein BO96DRAFT_164356 [Aspergillus niger CBS 101883]|uniref:uncharacterized protein n=1 Tax=Aspergillus lacticoffeatus (strain CBS 101883) TaxID=1450533 RepID=UPI000D7F40C9|nr:uncharacterized protein BO96DRAFT_164356 [Aspergillus niger CBS 101883]PYH52383.1 hypothetical protein BO96DRAFT_164356 [Aspergillus niger CBS 101883]